jgi:hypothetical protein
MAQIFSCTVELAKVPPKKTCVGRSYQGVPGSSTQAHAIVADAQAADTVVVTNK